MKLQEKTLWKNIKSERFWPVYLITGSEGYLKQKYVALLAEHAVPAGLEAFNSRTLNGDQFQMEELIDAVTALPAMSPRTCTLVHDLDFSSLKEEDYQQMLELLGDLTDTGVLIFWQDTKGFPLKTKKMKELQKAIDRAGAVVTLDARTHGDLVAFLQSTCQKQGNPLSAGAAEYLLNSVGEDMNTLVNEVEKLCNYADGAITEKEIDAVSVKSLEATAFQMVDALLDGNFDRVFHSLNILFEQRTEPMMILGALISTYSDMYRVKVATEAGAGPQILKRYFPQAYRSDFKLRNAARRSKRFTLGSLRRSLEILAEADATLKSSMIDQQTVFEKLLIELGRVRARQDAC